MAVNGYHRLRIAILGCGFMGTALLQGWLRDQESNHTFTAYVRTEASLDRLKKDLEGCDAQKVRFETGDSLVQAAQDADIVLLGFVPDSLQCVLQIPGLVEKLRGKIIISMLAGVALSHLESTLVENGSKQDELRLARVIPTLAAKVGKSITTLASDGSTPKHIYIVEGLFKQLGSVQPVPENLMNETTAIGAAIHALVIVAVDAATDASVADGVPRSMASSLITSSLQSALGLMTEGQMSPEQVKAAMSTPAGITLNSVVKLDSTVRSGVQDAVRSAVKYTKGMST